MHQDRYLIDLKDFLVWNPLPNPCVPILIFLTSIISQLYPLLLVLHFVLAISVMSSISCIPLLFIPFQILYFSCNDIDICPIQLAFLITIVANIVPLLIDSLQHLLVCHSVHPYDRSFPDSSYRPLAASRSQIRLERYSRRSNYGLPLSCSIHPW